MSYRDVVLADAPLVYWRMEEAGGNFVDESGHSNTATAHAGLTYQQPGPGRTGYSVFLDGVTAYAQTGDIQRADPDSWTIETWLKTTQTGSGGTGIYDSGVYGPCLALDTTTGKLVTLKSHVVALLISTVAVNDGHWHHVVCTKTGISQHIYVDAVDVTDTPLATTATENNTNDSGFGALWVAATPDVGSFFQGYLDEVALYNGSLSLARVQAHYTAGSPEPTPSVMLPLTRRGTGGSVYRGA